MTSFTDSEEKKLIKLVSEQPPLYDPNSDDYHNYLVKETTWQSIGQTLHKPKNKSLPPKVATLRGEECKRKWKFIRDGYMRFKKRSKGGSVPPKNSKNKRHKLLAFLEESGAVSNRAEEPEVHIEENEDESSQDNFDETQYEYLDEKNFTFVATDSSLPSKVKRERDDYSTPKRQKTYDDRSEREENIVRKREDDVDLFCRHIAEVLRNLPPLYKAKAKKHISTVVSDYEIKAAQNCADTSEVTPEDGLA